jgi:hypothetical protein
MDAALTTRWSRWTTIVELFARRRPARNRVDPRSFVALRGELIAACRALAASGDDSKRALAESLEGLVQPFLTLRVLEKTDRVVLFDLLVRCRDAERVVRGRPSTGAAGRRVAPLFLTTLFGLAAFLLLGATWGRWIPLWHRMQAWSDAAWISIKRSNDLQWVVLFGVVVVLASIAVISRPARS